MLIKCSFTLIVLYSLNTWAVKDVSPMVSAKEEAKASQAAAKKKTEAAAAVLQEENKLEEQLNRVMKKIKKKYAPLKRETASEGKKWDEKIEDYKDRKEREKGIEFIR